MGGGGGEGGAGGSVCSSQLTSQPTNPSSCPGIEGDGPGHLNIVQVDRFIILRRLTIDICSTFVTVKKT